MADAKELMEDQWKKYASYVILERALPRVEDGLKPVQRRLLHALRSMHDGKMHKVANVVGQTMAYHPHGDAPIYEALVNLANKGFLLDMQGNFGNPATGDPAAAARYIETRLTPLAIEALFNPELTSWQSSYDGRNQEPLYLPCKLPLLLMQGVEGIAVGMATRLLPHNFSELLQAQIDLLEGRLVTLLPDFPTGGIMDGADYQDGLGKIRLRARIELADPKTIVIKEICYGTTTESLIRSIDEAAKKGKIKIDAIDDYTAEQIEIQIKLPRGHYAEELIEGLYAFTECEVVLHSHPLVIKEGHPLLMRVTELLSYQTEQLQQLLGDELRLEAAKLKEKIFLRSLEQLFIEERLYLSLEGIRSEKELHQVLASALDPFVAELLRAPLKADYDHLLQLPMRRISQFDRSKNEKQIAADRQALQATEKKLAHLKAHTIGYLRHLLEQYGQQSGRRTQLQSLEQIDRRAIEVQELVVRYDQEKGFFGTKVEGGRAIHCKSLDKMLCLYTDGSYQVLPIQEKFYLQREGKQVSHLAIADKATTFNVIYRDPATLLAYAKRFVVSQYILEKSYRYLEEGMELLSLSIDPPAQLRIFFVPKVRQRTDQMDFSFADVAIKGVAAKGIRLAPRAVKKVQLIAPASAAAAEGATPCR